MITPSQIREKRISTVENGGYDRDEVNELLLEIIDSYEAIYNENKELYRKMEVLANRIEEYRADEDSIKTALITAQKMAAQVTNEAKEKADKALSDSAQSAQQTVVDAQTKADKIIGEAREYVANLTQEKVKAADEIVEEAKQKANDAIDSAKVVAANVLSQAKQLATEVVGKAKAERDFYNDIVTKLKEESRDFRTTLVSLYETQLSKLNDFTQPTESIVKDEQDIAAIELELNKLLADITEVVGDDEQEPEEEAQEQIVEEIEADDDTDDVVDEPCEDAEPEVIEYEIKEEENSNDDLIDEVDEIIEELESSDLHNYEPLQEEEESLPPTQEEVSSAIDAFSADEITPIDDSVKAIPVIEDEPEFENAMPFESFFNVKKEEERTNETISLLPPDDDDDEEDNSRFKGFFKKKK